MSIKKEIDIPDDLWEAIQEEMKEDKADGITVSVEDFIIEELYSSLGFGANSPGDGHEIKKEGNA